MRERWLPWLLVLPALLFVTPLSPLAADPYPHLAGTGWAVLLLVPLALFVLFQGRPTRACWPFLGALLWALVSWRLAPLTDTFEARRALLVLCWFPLLLAGGAALSSAGRARFQGLCVWLSCAWTGVALWSGFADANFAGVLGDTGSLSQAALPGAAIGALWLARERGARRAGGGLALALFLVHVGSVPVLAGSHTLLAGLSLAAWRGTGPRRGALAALALAALLAPFVGLALRQAVTGEVPPSVEGAPAAPSHSLGGLGVRALVWKAAAGLVGDHALLGAGPGQFQAAFPPHRDPREIELSRHGTCSELDTEVEHAHNDWLQAFCELGLPGGLLFALGLALCARAALHALHDEERLPLAVAALALLVNACVHAPLWANPASAVLASASFGALLGRSDPAPGGRLRALALAAPLLVAAPFALALVRHGFALCAYTRAAGELVQLPMVYDIGSEFHEQHVRPLAEEMHAAIVEARAAAPDSVPGRVLAAREAAGSPEFWDAVLEKRAHMVEAWEQSGTVHARQGRYGPAHERYGRALELSPTHPRILRNAARLELTQGDAELGRDLVERLRAGGCFEQDWLDSLGCELVLVLGRPGRGAPLLFGDALAHLSPEALHARALAPAARDATRPPELLAHHDEAVGAAAECLAQLLWAREHAASGAFDVALRNYRQAAQRSAARRDGRATEDGWVKEPAPLYALELAAAELRADRRDEARRSVEGIPLERATWAELPPWARDALGDLGLTPPSP